MLVAWFVNITILPALLSRLPVPRRRPPRVADSASLQGWIQRHARTILGVSTVIVIASASLLPAARFDLNPLNLKDGSTEGVAAFRMLASDPGNSPYTIQVLAPSLAEADRLATRLAALPEVDKTLTLSTFVPTAQEEKLSIIEGLQFALAGALEPMATSEAIAATEEVTSMREFTARLGNLTGATAYRPEFTTSLTRLHGLLQQLAARPDGLEALVPRLRTQLIGDLSATLTRLSRLLEAAPITLESLPATLRATYIANDGRARIQVMPKADLNDNQAMREFVRAVQREAPEATDAPVELYEGSRVVISACITASLWALVLTLILHIVVLHGVLDALLVAAPLVLAMMLTVATSVLCGVPFNFANIIALPLLIGLNNAYGAYLVVRKHSAADVSGLLASSTPRAILFSGITAIASFGVLGISKHPGMAGMGILISVSLSYAIVCALIVLPALMAVLETRKSITS
jgi:hopanoid biosynthesis associated RND transporter like protein HpnN